jgi:hypothetical protein
MRSLVSWPRRWRDVSLPNRLWHDRWFFQSVVGSFVSACGIVLLVIYIERTQKIEINPIGSFAIVDKVGDFDGRKKAISSLKIGQADERIVWSGYAKELQYICDSERFKMFNSLLDEKRAKLLIASGSDQYLVGNSVIREQDCQKVVKNRKAYEIAYAIFDEDAAHILKWKAKPITLVNSRYETGRPVDIREIPEIAVKDSDFPTNQPSAPLSVPGNQIAPTPLLSSQDRSMQLQAIADLNDRLNADQVTRANPAAAQAQAQIAKSLLGLTDSNCASGQTEVGQAKFTELNSELLLARSKTAEARARLDRVHAILSNDAPEAAVATAADTPKDDVMTKLVSQYLELSAREADWAVRYGDNHLAVVNLHTQMSEIRSSIRDELQRIAQTYSVDYQIAMQREKSIEQVVSQLRVAGQAQGDPCTPAGSIIELDRANRTVR